MVNRMGLKEHIAFVGVVAKNAGMKAALEREAPPEMLIDAINNHPSLQRFKILYVPGNYSRILSRLHRMTEMDIRRTFTAFQLMTILEEIQHTLVIIEHDPLLFEDQNELQDYVSMTMKQSATTATILLYAPGMDSSFGRDSFPS